MFIENIIGAMRFQKKLINMLVEDLSDDQMVLQQGTLKNHPAWQIGHLTDALVPVIEALKGEIPEGLSNTQNFGKGSTPSADKAVYPPKEILLANYVKAHDVVAKQLVALTDEDLAKPAPAEFEVYKKICPLLGNGISFKCITHENMHIGQLMTWRKALGFSGVIG